MWPSSSTLKNSLKKPPGRSVRPVEKNFPAGDEHSGRAGRTIEMPYDWHRPVWQTDFSRLGLWGALTPSGSLLDFEVSLMGTSVFFGGKFFDNSAVDLFRFRPARDRVTGTDWMARSAPSGVGLQSGRELMKCRQIEYLDLPPAVCGSLWRRRASSRKTEAAGESRPWMASNKLKGLILAQSERWRRGLGMQVEREP